MPQINEFSWETNFLMFLLMFFLMSINSFFIFKKSAHSNFNIISFKFLI